jgi:hypothetical protein
MRPVIDLNSLNQFIENFHFQVEHLSAIKNLLKDAYLSISSTPLWFEYSPSHIHMVVKTSDRFLRKRGVRLVIHLNNIILNKSTSS